LRTIRILALIAVLLGCPGPVLGQAAFNELKAVAVIPGSFPPDFMVDEAGNHVGFALDVMDRVARLAGVKIIYQVLDSWDEVDRALAAGEADLTPIIGLTPERRKILDFTPPLATSNLAVFVRAGTEGIQSVGDLKSRRVGVAGLEAQKQLLQRQPGIETVVLPSPDRALYQLLSGGVDALTYPTTVLIHQARADRVEDQIKTVGQPLEEIKQAIAVRKGNKALLGLVKLAANEFISSPDYNEIYKKWYGKALPFWTVSRAFWTMGLLAAAVLVVAALWHYGTLIGLNRNLRENIGARAEAERSLEAERQRLFNLLDGLPAYIYLLAPDSTIRFANGYFRERFGRPEGKRCHEIFLDREKACSLCDLSGIPDLPEPYGERTWADAQGRTYQAYHYPFIDVDGSPLTLEFGIDVTELKKAEEQIRLSLAEKEVLLREIHHRVKNNMQVISSLIWLQSAKMDNPQVEEALMESHNRIKSMALIHESLYQSKNLSEIDLDDFIHSLVRDLSQALTPTKSRITFLIEAQGVRLGIDQALPCGLIINELVTNSLKYAFPDDRPGRIRISAVRSLEGAMELTVEDDGVGLPQGFEPAGSESLGFQLVTRLAELQLDGSWNVEAGMGTRVTIRWPLAA